jgi:hypothetical protein
MGILAAAPLAGKLAFGLGAAGLGIQAAGSIQQARAENKAAEYNAKLAEQNARMQDAQAQDAIVRGQEDERRQRLAVEKMKGDQRAGFAASGVVVDRDSALDALEETAYMGEQDALTIRANAAREAWGNQVQASNYRSQAKLQRKSKSNPYFGAAGGLLTGGSSLLGRI